MFRIDQRRGASIVQQVSGRTNQALSAGLDVSRSSVLILAGARVFRAGANDLFESVPEVDMILSREHLRGLNASSPEIAERLISLQGSAGFGRYVDDLLQKEENGSSGHVDDKVASTLHALKAEHDQSFPRFAARSAVFSEKNTVQREKIQMIAATFPHIGKNLVEKWGSRDFCEYISDLFIDRRGGRQGFPSEILFALLNLRDDHEKEYPEFVREITNVWVRVADF